MMVNPVQIPEMPDARSSEPDPSSRPCCPEDDQYQLFVTAQSVFLTTSLLTASVNPIEYWFHIGYFEKNNSGLKGEASYLAITDRETFDERFGIGNLRSTRRDSCVSILGLLLRILPIPSRIWNR
jgi:hypothetical protein